MRSWLKPYPATKNSGVPWLGEVPQHWNVQRGKWLFRYRKEINADRASSNVLSLTLRGVVNNDPDNPEGLVPKDYATYQLFRKGDLVFKLIDLENLRTSRVGLVHEDGIMSSAYVRLTPKSAGDVRFFFQQYFDLYQRGIYNQLGAGVRSTLGPSDLLDLNVVVPPPAEQAAIVRFLDHADRRIRRYIGAKRRLIELLNEQKQAIIHQAVTRGLDPSVRLKPSGVDWLGDVPEHWEVRRMKQTSHIFRGKFTHRPRNDPSLYDGPYPFIQTGAVARAEKFITGYAQTLNAKGLAVSKLFPSGTLVLTIAANIGDVAVLKIDACFPDSVVGFVPFKDTDQDYLYLVLRCMKPEFIRQAPVNTQGNLNVERIGAMGTPLPPIEEQRGIVHDIEDKTAAFDIATNRARSEIELLGEYCTRLIADVVTGKLDVHGVRLPATDEVDALAPPGDETADDATEEGDELEPVEESTDAGD